jgi:hypothetical protein
VALRKGFGDACMFVAVSVSHAKLPLPGILPPAHRNHRHPLGSVRGALSNDRPNRDLRNPRASHVFEMSG